MWGSTACVDTLELRALTDISAGTEITVNYIGDKCLLMDPGERNKLLGQTWGFSCTCPACQEDTDQAGRKLLGLLKNKMREKLCLANFEDLFKLHNQKLIALQKMKAFNHQELLNCLQVRYYSRMIYLIIEYISPDNVSCILCRFKCCCPCFLVSLAQQCMVGYYPGVRCVPGMVY